MDNGTRGKLGKVLVRVREFLCCFGIELFSSFLQKKSVLPDRSIVAFHRTVRHSITSRHHPRFFVDSSLWSLSCEDIGRRLSSLLDVLALGVLLWGLGDGETCSLIRSVYTSHCMSRHPCRLTWRKRLLQLLSLVVVLEDKGVEVAVASDLELGLVGSARLLYPRGCENIINIGAT